MNRSSGSNCRNDKWGPLHLGGPNKEDGDPVEEMKLVVDRTKSTPRGGGRVGERTGSGREKVGEWDVITAGPNGL